MKKGRIIHLEKSVTGSMVQEASYVSIPRNCYGTMGNMQIDEIMQPNNTRLEKVDDFEQIAGHEIP